MTSNNGKREWIEKVLSWRSDDFDHDTHELLLAKSKALQEMGEAYLTDLSALTVCQAELAEAKAMYTDQRHAYNEEKKRYGELNEMIAKLETALEAMICEAQTQLALYTQAYKREPYDTGILFQIHIKESVDRI